MAKKAPPGKPSLEVGIARLRSKYGGRFRPPLEGLAYRFTIWLPVQAKGRPVFTAQHRTLLRDLFNDCFGGYSQTAIEGFPPWTGSWVPAVSEDEIVDHHMLLVVYSLQDSDAVGCVKQLKWLLQQDHIAAQQVVLIERLPVHLVESEALA